MPGKWAIMYLCVMGIDFPLSKILRFWKCPDSVLFLFMLIHIFDDEWFINNTLFKIILSPVGGAAAASFPWTCPNYFTIDAACAAIFCLYVPGAVCVVAIWLGGAAFVGVSAITTHWQIAVITNRTRIALPFIFKFLNETKQKMKLLCHYKL